MEYSPASRGRRIFEESRGGGWFLERRWEHKVISLPCGRRRTCRVHPIRRTRFVITADDGADEVDPRIFPYGWVPLWERRVVVVVVVVVGWLFCFVPSKAFLLLFPLSLFPSLPYQLYVVHYPTMYQNKKQKIKKFNWSFSTG